MSFMYRTSVKWNDIQKQTSFSEKLLSGACGGPFSTEMLSGLSCVTVHSSLKLLIGWALLCLCHWLVQSCQPLTSLLQSLASSRGIEDINLNTEPLYYLHVMRKQWHPAGMDTAQEAVLKQRDEVHFCCLMQDCKCMGLGLQVPLT